MSTPEVSEDNAALSATLSRQLDVKGRDLKTVSHKARHLLPRGLRRDAEYLVQAEKMASHPKLRAQIDTQRVQRAERHLRVYARDKDPAYDRQTRLLQRLAGVAFCLLVVAALFIAVLAWRGFIGPGAAG